MESIKLLVSHKKNIERLKKVTDDEEKCADYYPPCEEDTSYEDDCE